MLLAIRRLTLLVVVNDCTLNVIAVPAANGIRPRVLTSACGRDMRTLRQTRTLFLRKIEYSCVPSGGLKMFGEVPSKRTRVSILKLRSGHESKFVCASDDVFSFTVHWIGARSYVCPGAECQACFSGVGGKWLGLLYVGLLGERGVKPRYGCLELTEAAYYRLRDCSCGSGASIKRGFQFASFRRLRKSPMSFRPLTDAESQGIKLPKIASTFLADGVATLYGLPSVGTGETVATWSSRVEGPAARLIELALSRLPAFSRP